jgi:hypothetical protein
VINAHDQQYKTGNFTNGVSNQRYQDFGIGLSFILLCSRKRLKIEDVSKLFTVVMHYFRGLTVYHNPFFQYINTPLSETQQTPGLKGGK